MVTYEQLWAVIGGKMRWGGLLIQRDKVKDKIDAGINKKYIKMVI